MVFFYHFQQKQTKANQKYCIAHTKYSYYVGHNVQGLLLENETSSVSSKLGSFKITFSYLHRNRPDGRAVTRSSLEQEV